jgi:organic hydroperoxide reductase OsmC/OhrA
MSEHKAIIHWQNTVGADFLKGKFSREHTWTFDGGTVLQAAASPSVVPVPYTNPAFVDPEEAFVASVSSCHMLTFVFLAGRKGFVVESYIDNAVGHMTKDEKGAAWISSIELSPTIIYGGAKFPTPADEEILHHHAHEQCFIANSVRTKITVRSPK